MDRKEFIKKIGAGAFVALTITCCGACTKMNNPEPPVDSVDYPEENFDFTIDLILSENAPLQNNGGFIVIDNKYVVGRDNLGEYWATTKFCSHHNVAGIIWGANENEWLCTLHNATFSTSGEGTHTYNNLGNKGIVVYNTELIGTKLRIYS
jgi:nitrite reductase/ring-hydroxylating ferredoxin subunit